MTTSATGAVSPRSGRTIAHHVGGAAWHGFSDRHTPVWDPRTGTAVGRVPLGGAKDVGWVAEVAAARQLEWSSRTPRERGRVLFAFRDLLRSQSERLAATISFEHGKTLEEARAEIARAVESVEFACGVPALLAAATSSNVAREVDAWGLRQPVGIAVGITPSNFPVMAPAWMYPLAIACGNSFILKPSEVDPAPSVMVASLWQEAGLPPGVFNVLHGDSATARALIDETRVAAVTIVGSTGTARDVYSRASRNGKRVQALGGAKNHAVVLSDCDLDEAVRSTASGAFGMAGQRCMAISVAVVVESIADSFVKQVAETIDRMEAWWHEESTTPMGPLASSALRDRACSFISQGCLDGAWLVRDGRAVEVPSEIAGGFWLGPTLFDQVQPWMSIYGSEIFGPVLCVLRVSDLDSAIAIVNQSPYGNGAAIFTRDAAAARHFAHEVDVGMVGINIPVPVPSPPHSFGGRKASLFGSLHVGGWDGVAFYTRAKMITARWA
jgi:malonate-semialdehyde dehydrogenase (acetylating) / methylmalonate-semialdehyde dehydrogenase